MYQGRANTYTVQVHENSRDKSKSGPGRSTPFMFQYLSKGVFSTLVTACNCTRTALRMILSDSFRHLVLLSSTQRD